MAPTDALPSQAASTECAEEAPLTPSELSERLRLGDASLVEELHQTALRRIDFETELGARIEQRASSLIGQCGIAVTVALGVNGLLLKSIEEPTVLSSACGWVALGFVAAIALGVASTVFALLATRVRERRICVNERVIFHDAELRAAEASAPSGERAAVTRYRRFTTNHLWQIGAALAGLNEEKALRLHVAQWLFAAFLVLFGVTGLALTFVVIVHGQAG